MPGRLTAMETVANSAKHSLGGRAKWGQCNAAGINRLESVSWIALRHGRSTEVSLQYISQGQRRQLTDLCLMPYQSAESRMSIMLSGELRPGRSPINTTTTLAPSSAPTSSPMATRPCRAMQMGAIDQFSALMRRCRMAKNGAAFCSTANADRPSTTTNAKPQDHGALQRADDAASAIELALLDVQIVPANSATPKDGVLQLGVGAQASHEAVLNLIQPRHINTRWAAAGSSRCGRLR